MVALTKKPPLVEKIDRLVPTERQAEFLASILQLKRELGNAPNLRQIAVRNSVSLKTVQNQLAALHEMGCVTWKPLCGRTLAVTEGVLFLGDVQ